MGKNKIILGTVQFGCQYGINSAGRPSVEMVTDILKAASAAGISTLDTSSAYGDAERVLGSCLGRMEEKFDIVSKYPKGAGRIPEVFDQSCHTLGSSCLYGYLLHHFIVYTQGKECWKEFLELRESGRVSRIGFSLYSPQELEVLLEDGVDFDLIQIPRNIFDRRFDSYLPELKRKGVEIHVRSTFLQGLFFKDRDSLPEKLKPLKRYLLDLDEYAVATGLSLSELALNYNLQNPCVDKVLIGVDNTEQLLANVAAVSDKKIELDINVSEQDLLSPVNWN